MKRVMLVLVAVVMLVGLAAPVMARVVVGDSGDDRLRGTRGDDRLNGRAGDDKIRPRAGDDRVFAGAGDDLIYARDARGRDYIDCGAGFDKVETIHRDDKTLSNCERTPGKRDI